VKCDEAKPNCYVCTSTGRKCDGYGPNTESPPDLSSPLSSALSSSPTIGFLSTEKELQSFEFFQLRTAPQLSGFLGGDIWGKLLLQAALHEPSIRHALLALGSLHTKYAQDHGSVVQNHTSKWNDDFALKNYTQAINVLVDPLSRQRQRAIDVCLICSILFACIEVSCFEIRPSFLLIVYR
jgi:hypothetical protein